MPGRAKRFDHLEILPLTPDRWADFERLFGPNGASSGCWCMYWRMGKEYSSTKGEPHRKAMHALVDSGVETGLIAYADGIPAGWVTVAPRTDYARLATSRTLYPVDEHAVWSIPCFFIHRNYRGSHLMKRLIDGALEYARAHGANLVEAYPIDVKGNTSSGNLYTGIQQVFEACGFAEVARRGDRPILRRMV